jgi:hypothetical protein
MKDRVVEQHDCVRILSWSQLASEVKRMAGAVQQHMIGAVRHTWAIGELICRFAERSDVLAEVSRFNQRRSGRPWIARNYVAYRLAESLPYEKRWLQMCAKAYETALAKGQLPEGSISAMLQEPSEKIAVHEGPLPDVSKQLIDHKETPHALPPEQKLAANIAALRRSLAKQVPGDFGDIDAKVWSDAYEALGALANELNKVTARLTKAS